MTVRTRSLAILVLAAGALLTASCSDDDEAEPIACSEHFADGTETEDLNDQPTCLDDSGKEQTVASSSSGCGDERIFYNDFGYGIQGEDWHTDATSEDIGSGSPLDAAIEECSGR